ncbi:MAG: AbrB family transcriptional regulator [Sphingomonas sp.]
MTRQAIARVALMLVASAVLGGLLEIAGIPAGLLLGPLVVGIAFAATGHKVEIPGLAFRAAQAIVGVLIARALDADIVRTVAQHPLLFFGSALATLAASGVLGYLLSHWQVLPGTAGVWGSMPGAATAMTLMARSFGADARLVAVMAYLRVVCVAAIASVMAMIASGSTGAHPPGGAWFPPLHALPFAETIAVAAIGAAGGILIGLPAGALLGPIVLGAALNIAGVIHVELPGWLLAVSYAVVGWRIGLSFTREIVATAKAALPRILLSIGLLLAFCAGIAVLIASTTNVDLVTAYLATSPGGMDSVAIIAASTHVDVPFVMALQALRFVTVLVAGPALFRLIARQVR